MRTERPETLAMVWPTQQASRPPPDPPPGYRLSLSLEQPDFEAVQRTIGFAVRAHHWRAVQDRLAAAAVVRHGDSPVAVACGEHQDDGSVELGWVAVAPEHRDRQLGFLVCAALTHRLVEMGAGPLHGSTQDERRAALAIYFKVGFHPVWRAEKESRWRAVCDALDVPWRPAAWGWPGTGG